MVHFFLYYRESLPAYDACLFMFKTEHEDFIIDLFSQLSTTCWFYRVSDNLIAETLLEKSSGGKENIHTRNVTELQIPLLVRDLVRKEILKSEAHAKAKCYWRKKTNDI
jgi:hypothetical protein